MTKSDKTEDKTDYKAPDVRPIVASSEIDLLRAEVAALKAKTTPKDEVPGRAVCNACGDEIKESGEGQGRCPKHPRETVNVCYPDGTFKAY